VGSPRSAASPQRQVAAKQAAKPIAEAAGVSPEILQARAYLQSTNPEPTKLARMNDLYTAINCNCWAGAKMLEQIMEGYEEPLVDADPDLRSRRPECVQVVMRQAVKRTWDHLAKERLEDTHPTIPLGKRFWPVTNGKRVSMNTEGPSERSSISLIPRTSVGISRGWKLSS
jgi:hypothetical protein